MQKILLFLLMAIGSVVSNYAQTNTLPSSGNVGIGTTSPSAPLDVQGQVLIGLNSPAYGVRMRMDFPGYSGGWARSFSIFDQNDDPIIKLGSYGGATNGIVNLNYSYIGKQYNDTYMVFKPNGNVGIGTTSPTSKLDVEGNIRTSNSIEFSRGSGEYSNYIRSQNYPSTGQDGASQKYWLEYGTKGGHHFVVNTNGGVGSVENVYDDFTIWQGEVDGDRLMSVSNIGNTYISGNVGIGTTDPGAYKLAVNGNIHTKEVKVDLIGWADYVFTKDYDLPSLEEVQKHITENGHLINIPSAEEVAANGIELGRMDKLLLEKIEELTLYVIQLKKELDKQQREIQSLMWIK